MPHAGDLERSGGPITSTRTLIGASLLRDEPAQREFEGRRRAGTSTDCRVCGQEATHVVTCSCHLCDACTSELSSSCRADLFDGSISDTPITCPVCGTRGMVTFVQTRWGVKRFDNGDVYEGELRDEEPHRKGRMEYADGSVYEGGWKGAKREGSGTMRYANGDDYDGEWKGGEREGRGTLRYTDGTVYEGGWKGGVKEGRGTYEFANGRVYEGEWKGGVRQGMSAKLYPDGRVCGERKGGEREGRGALRCASGKGGGAEGRGAPHSALDAQKSPHRSNNGPDAALVRVLDHDTHPRLPYREPPPRGPKAGATHRGELKTLCAEADFLNRHAGEGDVVVYASGSGTDHLAALSAMFPMVTFDVYGTPPAQGGRRLPPRGPSGAGSKGGVRVMRRRLQDSDTAAYRRMGPRVLLISDLRMRARRAGGTQGAGGASDQDVVDSLGDQERLAASMCPRQALLQFRLPYKGYTKVDCLAGDLRIQPFTHRASTEVRLHVFPMVGSGGYARKLYSCRDHEETMFHHNTVTRRAHATATDCWAPGEDSGRKGGARPLSYDQELAHAVLGEWADKVKRDPDMAMGRDEAGVDAHIAAVFSALDGSYGRVLALRRSGRFGGVVGVNDGA